MPVKALGFLTMIKTNGSCAGVLHELLSFGLLDFVAMDIKAPLPRYHILAGVPVDVRAIEDSMGLIASCGIPHEFRTTVVESRLSADDLDAVRDLVPKGSCHRLQEFRPKHACDRGLHRFSAKCVSRGASGA